MSNTINFEEKTPHMVRIGRCGLCKQRSVNVIPLWHNSQYGLSCIQCGTNTVLYELNQPDPTPPPKRCI